MTRPRSVALRRADQANNGRGVPWVCQSCGKPMGELFRQKVHLHPPRSHSYFATYPVTAICCGCGYSNKIDRIRSR